MNPRGRPTIAGSVLPFIEVRYRGYGRSMARVTNLSSVAAEQLGIDDGVRGEVHHVKAPAARTAVDCENAALSIVIDSAAAGWAESIKHGAISFPAARRMSSPETA